MTAHKFSPSIFQTPKAQISRPWSPSWDKTPKFEPSPSPQPDAQAIAARKNVYQEVKGRGMRFTTFGHGTDISKGHEDAIKQVEGLGYVRMTLKESGGFSLDCPSDDDFQSICLGWFAWNGERWCPIPLPPPCYGHQYATYVVFPNWSYFPLAGRNYYTLAEERNLPSFTSFSDAVYTCGVVRDVRSQAQTNGQAEGQEQRNQEGKAAKHKILNGRYRDYIIRSGGKSDHLERKRSREEDQDQEGQEARRTPKKAKVEVQLLSPIILSS
ncbi:hypothetical protein BT69DRAFT_1299884 [Atractiella rhizophila]|nr:hypothetical protein BT69DRAFT_1299884 [Atractiella rhizophila]